MQSIPATFGDGRAVDTADRILIVDDERDFAESLAEVLEDRGWTVRRAEGGRDALTLADAFGAQIALVDMNLGSENGIDVSAALKRWRPDLITIVVTAFADLRSAVEAMRSGFDDYLAKPLRLDELFATLERARTKLELIDQRRAAEDALRMSEERYRLLVDLSPDAVFVHSRGKVVFANPATVELLGAESADQVIGMEALDIMHPDSRERIRALRAEIGEHRKPVVVEPMRYVRFDGTERSIQSNAAPFEWGGGNAFMVVARDVTEREQAERALRDSEARFRAIVEDQTELIGRTLPHVHTLTFVNEAYARYFGKSPDEMIGTSFMDHVPEAERAAIDAQLATLGPENRVIHIEHAATNADGETRWHEWTDRAIFDDQGNITEIQAVGRDITEMKQAVETIRLSEEKFSKAFRSGPDSFLITRISDGTIVDSNARFIKMVGRGLEDVVGRRVSELTTWVDPEVRVSLMKAIEATGECSDLEAQFRYADGGLVDCLVSAQAIEVDGDACILTITRDISERKRAETALRESEERYRLLIEASPDALMVAGKDGILTFANTTAADLHGAQSADQLVGMDMMALVHPDDRADVAARRQRTLLGSLVPFSERRRLRLDGSDFYSESRGVPFAWDGDTEVLIVIRDITERKQIEEQLRHAQKIEAIGQLTGGVAHDFNNLLTVILGNLQLLQRRFAGDEKSEQLADAALKATHQGADLVRHLLAFARKQPLQPVVVYLNQLVEDSHAILRATVGEICSVELRLGDGLGIIRADPGQLKNALLNLSINARQAMPQGGTLTIETRNIHLEAGHPALSNEEIAPGRYVALSVRDTGTGMSRDVVERAFDPFFTTKEVGEGSGLGLSMVYGFAKQSDGHAHIESRPGEGTTVTLCLPRSTGDDALVCGPSAAPAIRGGTETVLVVEDNADARLITVRLLSEWGYRVLEAEDGPDAMRVLRSTPDIDVLFTDLIMPNGMNGRELAVEIRRRCPKAKVLLASGYAGNDGEVSKLVDQDGVAFLTKPYRAEVLASTMRDLIGN